MPIRLKAASRTRFLEISGWFSTHICRMRDLKLSSMRPGTMSINRYKLECLQGRISTKDEDETRWGWIGVGKYPPNLTQSPAREYIFGWIRIYYYEIFGVWAGIGFLFCCWVTA